MKKINSKLKKITIAVILIAMLTLITMQTAMADPHPYTVKTYAYVEVNPRPVGVGQQAFVTFGIDKVPMTVSQAYGDRWNNLTLIIGSPDGTIKTLSGFVADDTGFSYTTWTPDRVGNYTFQCKFLGEYLTGENPPPTGFGASAVYIGDYYTPSESTVVTVTVTNEMASQLPMNPLPTGYWQRPVNMMNSNWNTISGNWFGYQSYTNAGYGYNMTGNYDPYTQIVNAPHVLWTTPLAAGGLIGGEYGNTLHSNFYSTAQYEPKFKEIIMDGILYYTYTPLSTSDPQGWIAQDIKTGQILWHKYDGINGTLRFGEIWNIITPNQYGGQMYLWSMGGVVSNSGIASGNAWSCYEATTGRWLFDVTGSGVNTAGDIMAGPAGDILDYYIDTSNTTQYYLTCWNSSRAMLGATGDVNAWRYGPTVGMNVTWSTGIQWKVPIAMKIDGNPITLSLTGPQSGGNIGIAGNSVVMAYGTTGNWMTWQVEASYSLTDGHQNFLVNRTFSDAPWPRVVTYTSGNGKYTEINEEGQYMALYNADTGSLVCKCLFPNPNFWTYLISYRPIEAYGLVYQGSYDGHVYAWNSTTGELKWTWYSGDSGYDTVYGSYPNKVIETVADGKVIINQGHTYNPPMFRGAHAVAINATTGETVWELLSFCHSNSPVVGAADGVLLLPNSYDNQVYAYGKGQSAMTVEAPAAALTEGQSLVIRGTVTDQSPGQTCLGIPAKGTPAISDASMEQWMEYLYEQQPMPTNATGVPISINVLDANQNFRQIGSTTSDANGVFNFQWTPDIQGKFVVYASFAGSESYYPSSAETSFVVDPAATPASTTQPTQQQVDNTMTILGSTIAVIVAIAIVGLLILRKRP
jgi:outer membrane protein assembly factor BamB